MTTEEKYLSRKVILVGYDRVGRRIGEMLAASGIPYVTAEESREIVLARRQPGVSIAAAALHYRSNANLLHRWAAAYEARDTAASAHEPAILPSAESSAEFVPLPLQARRVGFRRPYQRKGVARDILERHDPWRLCIENERITLSVMAGHDTSDFHGLSSRFRCSSCHPRRPPCPCTACTK
jgi:hypothetical protein